MRKTTFAFVTLLLPFFLVAQEYKKIHEKAIVTDTHNDVLSTVTMAGLDFENNLLGKSQSDIARFKEGGVDVQVFSIFCDERFGKDTAFKYANIEIDSLYAIVKRNPDKLMIVTTPKELFTAVKEKKLACMLGVEGGHMIEDDLNKLDSLFKRGVRYMTLTWNNSTSWASSAKDEAGNTVPNPKKGLNDFGKQIVKRMNELGMMVDISHVGEQTFWDAINTTTKPVIASHSSVYAICPVPRNLKDDQIKAVAKNGGVIDVNFFSGFIDSNYFKKRDIFFSHHKAEFDSLNALKKPEYEVSGYMSAKYPKEIEAIRPPLYLLIDHIDYIVKLVGVDYVGLGSDFDGIDSAPLGLEGVQDFPKITEALLQRGYSKKDIEKILGGNFIRVFKANSK
ncbi:MAG: dipeptidase [Bacteroidetes bacterium]|nr:dipeptidase [Bacteroidota bacterium]